MSWYLSKGPKSDIVISSRVRLARNIANYSFPGKLPAEEKDAVREQIEDALKPTGFLRVHMEELLENDRRCLVEKHLISDELSQGGAGTSVCISKDEAIGVMINEEDHIRVQAMTAGYALKDAYKKAMEICVLLEQALQLSYSEKYGFLTACPTNTGTGLRASVMLHLPALVMTGRIKHLIDGLTRSGFAVRGYQGEHSKPSGNLFQISNQVTLGISEKGILHGFSKVVDNILRAELQFRKKIYEEAPEKLEDAVYRSYGELLYARAMPENEALQRIGDLRLGHSLGFFQEVDEVLLAKIFNAIGAATLSKDKKVLITEKEENKVRAEKIRELLRE